MKRLEVAVTKRIQGTDTHSRILKCAALARKKVGKKQLTWGDCGQWAWAVVKYLNDPSIDFGLITNIDNHANTLHELSFHDPAIWHVFLEHKGRLYDGLGECDMDDIFGLMEGYEDEDDIMEWHDIKTDETVRRLIANDTDWKHDWTFYHKLFSDNSV